ncbi:MAG: hypothetical protein KGH88_08115 [Thaumarchaeota archaeon]|nr:hypothetical protein [Nitrososphaerota archaeon]
MAKEELQHIKKEIEKEMSHLRDLYNKINSMERREKPERYGIKYLEEQLRKKYPGLSVDKSLLRLVGTMPYNHPSKDRDVIRQVVTELHVK